MMYKLGRIALWLGVGLIVYVFVNVALTSEEPREGGEIILYALAGGGLLLLGRLLTTIEKP
ncbi:MAG: hypothetical protein AB8E82_20365 [Aureispira sp.]